jgi:anti-sigma regulatory factor (Ser/Thr protein kinase)
MRTEPTKPTGGETIHLMLRMKPPWVFIDEIRRFVESFCACACPGTNREAQLALAVHELMQNAIPHSQGQDVDLLLEVEPERDQVTVAVTNRASEAEHHALLERVARMNGEQDALAHYLKMMSESPATSRGGLGLARVRFEAQLELTVTYAEGRVTVRATGPLRAPALKIPGVAHV